MTKGTILMTIQVCFLEMFENDPSLTWKDATNAIYDRFPDLIGNTIGISHADVKDQFEVASKTWNK